MMRRGFTVVELLITITIMGILLTLAVVNLNASQANGRDAERKGDVENLALNIENFYTSQDPNIPMSGGRYPGTTYLTDAQINTYLPDLDPKNTHAPGVSVTGPISVVAATSATPSITGITPLPSRNNDVYVYQPLTASGALCTDPATDGDCRRFNIYYYQETDNAIHMVTSKHQ